MPLELLMMLVDVAIVVVQSPEFGASRSQMASTAPSLCIFHQKVLSAEAEADLTILSRSGD